MKCDQCGRPPGEHGLETDDSKMIGLYGPVDYGAPPLTWVICPLVEGEDELEDA